MPDNEPTFPLEWQQWSDEWRSWILRHSTVLQPAAKAIPGQNFLADEIIGTFRLPSGRVVELSEVTFPNLEKRDPTTGRLLDFRVRGVGITWADDRTGDVVHSFRELEVTLGL